MSEFRPTVWVRTNCPYSFKFRLFLTEAEISDQFEIIPMDPDSSQFAAEVDEISSRFGQKPVFPIVEVSPGVAMTDSDKLIKHFAVAFDVDDRALPTLSFYRSGLFVCYVEMFSLLSGPLGWLARLGRNPKAFR